MFLIYFFLLLRPIVANESNENKPIIQEITLPKNLNLNQVIRLNCDLIQGQQPLNFEWYHKSITNENERKIVNNNKTTIKIRDDSANLIIRSLSIEDLGDYKCKVQNSYGEHSQKVSLYTNVKPIWINEPKTDLISPLYKELSVNCDAVSYPKPVIKWNRLSNNGKETTKKELEQSNTLKLYLTKETAGFYRCTIENEAGKIEKTVKIKYYG